MSFDLFTTAIYPCSYLPQQMARNRVIVSEVNSEAYSVLLHLGFRRSGAFVYHPHCSNCEACQPMRVLVNDFQPTRSQRRIARQWVHLEVKKMRPVFLVEHFELYQKYQKIRHPDSQDTQDEASYKSFLVASQVDTWLIEFRMPHGAVCMVAVVDVVQDGLSAVYTFYDPVYTQGLGVYAVLYQLEWAKQLDKPFVYLGYWIKESARMAYKSRYRPNEILHCGQWTATNHELKLTL